MWGCFPYVLISGIDVSVFPTHVGVFLSKHIMVGICSRLPHACGGVSEVFFNLTLMGKSSPRMWGCFHMLASLVRELRVFPTHVGVFPPVIARIWSVARLPHACGGVSNSYIHLGVYYQSSPRMWGQFSSRTTYQRRAFHALGHIQQELRDGQAPRTPDLEKPFQTIPPPGILLGGHAGSPARGRHGFKPCPFRRSGRG